MYVQRITEERSCDQGYSKKAISITYSKCVFIALGIQHEMRMRHIAICGLSSRTTFFFPRYLIKGTIFERKKI